jgi:hypothetical protein
MTMRGSSNIANGLTRRRLPGASANRRGRVLIMGKRGQAAGSRSLHRPESDALLLARPLFFFKQESSLQEGDRNDLTFPGWIRFLAGVAAFCRIRSR